MARIKLKLGENEIEVDSRDFYVDNQTLGEIIENMSSHLPENHANVVYETEPVTTTEVPVQSGLETLEDAEIFEPEFNEPIRIAPNEVKSKLRILETSRFFDSPRTVTETVEQLREYGWSASPLDVSKVLAKMASNKEMLKNSTENRTHYFIEESLVTN
jgi:transcription initiation factor IIE alpha subunit